MSDQGTRVRQLIIDDGLRGRFVEENGELVPRLELINHLLLRKRKSIARRRHIESDEVIVAGLVETIDLVEDDSEHGERVKLLVDLLHVVSNDRDSVLHSEKSVSDNCEKLRWVREIVWC